MIRSTIGVIERGEFAGGIVALQTENVWPEDFVELASWTPHRYSLSIERNVIPEELAAVIRDQIVDSVEGDAASALSDVLFDSDYSAIVHGPSEGQIVECRHKSRVSHALDEQTMGLLQEVPMLQAMSDRDLIENDLLEFVAEALSARSSASGVRKLLKYCSRTADWGSDPISPDMAVRMWFSSLEEYSRTEGKRFRDSSIRDALRMAEALLDDGKFWVSGDWRPRLQEAICATMHRMT